MDGRDGEAGDAPRRGIAGDAGFGVALLLVVAACAAGGTLRCHPGTEVFLWAACAALALCAAAIALASRRPVTGARGGA